jgi:hypothetical protein
MFVWSLPALLPLAMVVIRQDEDNDGKILDLVKRQTCTPPGAPSHDIY